MRPFCYCCWERLSLSETASLNVYKHICKKMGPKNAALFSFFSYVIRRKKKVGFEPNMLLCALILHFFLRRVAPAVFMSDHKITGNKSQQHGIRLSASSCKRRINKQFVAQQYSRDGDTQRMLLQQYRPSGGVLHKRDL